jgi:hypothetical protein
MVVTAHGTTEQEGVEFAVAVAGQAGTCEGPKWRHADGLSQKCWVTLPAAPGKTQVTATARLSGPGWVAQAAGGTYGVAAHGTARHRTLPRGARPDPSVRQHDGRGLADLRRRVRVRGGTARGSGPADRGRRARPVLRRGHVGPLESRAGGGDSAPGPPRGEPQRQPPMAQHAGGTRPCARRSPTAPAADEPRLLRPGYGGGVFTNRVRDAAAELGLGLCFWTVDPRDWAGPTADVITSRVLVGDAKTPPVAAGGHRAVPHDRRPHGGGPAPRDRRHPREGPDAGGASMTPAPTTTPATTPALATTPAPATQE